MFLVQVIFLLKILIIVESQYPPPMPNMPPMPPLPPMQFPNSMPMGGPMQNPMMQMPGPMSMHAMQAPMSMPGPLGSMPMMMPPGMPFTIPHRKKSSKSSKRKSKKRKSRRNKNYIQSFESDTSGGSSCDSDGNCGTRRSNGRRRQILTPVISYVTKDGYVVYQKKINKEKAKEWLDDSGRKANNQPGNSEVVSSSEEALRKILKRKLKKTKKAKS